MASRAASASRRNAASCSASPTTGRPATLPRPWAATLERDRAAAIETLLVKSAFAASEIAAAVAALTDAGKTVQPSPGLVADAIWWKAVRQRAAGFIDEWHRAHPEQTGLPLDRLRADLGRELPLPPLFDSLVRGDGFIQNGNAVRRASHRPALPPALRPAGERIRAALTAHPLEPPSVTQLAPDANARQALRFLRETGEVIELGPELVLTVESFRRMRAAVVRYLRSQGAATASDLRQMLGTTRRVMIPVLEQLDREGVTRREGDRRVVRT